MATFDAPTRDTTTITNAPLSGNSRTWDEATETWNENSGTWDNPYVPEIGTDKHTTTITNPTRN